MYTIATTVASDLVLCWGRAQPIDRALSTRLMGQSTILATPQNCCNHCYQYFSAMKAYRGSGHTQALCISLIFFCVRFFVIAGTAVRIVETSAQDEIKTHGGGGGGCVLPYVVVTRARGIDHTDPCPRTRHGGTSGASTRPDRAEFRMDDAGWQSS